MLWFFYLFYVVPIVRLVHLLICLEYAMCKFLTSYDGNAKHKFLDFYSWIRNVLDCYVTPSEFP